MFRVRNIPCFSKQESQAQIDWTKQKVCKSGNRCNSKDQNAPGQIYIIFIVCPKEASRFWRCHAALMHRPSPIIFNGINVHMCTLNYFTCTFQHCAVKDCGYLAQQVYYYAILECLLQIEKILHTEKGGFICTFSLSISLSITL